MYLETREELPYPTRAERSMERTGSLHLLKLRQPMNSHEKTHLLSTYCVLGMGKRDMYEIQVLS